MVFFLSLSHRHDDDSSVDGVRRSASSEMNIIHQSLHLCVSLSQRLKFIQNHHQSTTIFSSSSRLPSFHQLDHPIETLLNYWTALIIIHYWMLIINYSIEWRQRSEYTSLVHKLRRLEHYSLSLSLSRLLHLSSIYIFCQFAATIIIIIIFNKYDRRRGLVSEEANAIGIHNEWWRKRASSNCALLFKQTNFAVCCWPPVVNESERDRESMVT